MAEYLVIAENVVFKNDKLTCINIYDRFTTVAMPAEFAFDMAIMCGPHWSVGDHKLVVKVKASNGNEFILGDTTINVPNEDFVYNAFLNNVKITMDYSVTDLTFVVTDGDKEILTRKYPVISMLVPQANNPEETPAKSTKAKSKTATKTKTSTSKKK